MDFKINARVTGFKNAHLACCTHTYYVEITIVYYVNIISLIIINL